MKVIEKDPREPFVVGTERLATIRRQIDEVMEGISPNIFFHGSRVLDAEINNCLADLDAEIKDPKKVKTDEVEEVERIHRLAGQWVYGESRRRTPDQLAEEERQRLERAAVAVLEKIHTKRMAGRLAHWQTTCRLDGCDKQPRTSSRAAMQRKAHRRTFVFCPGHAGVRNQISKADYNRLKINLNLRVIAE